MTPEQAQGVAFARPSATIVVVRDGKPAPEILLVKRRAGDAFGDSYTFPGGVIDQHDADPTLCSSGVTMAEANTMLGIDANGLDYYSAGIRELFEETGILLARDRNTAWANRDGRLDELRSQVDQGTTQWGDVLRQLELSMAFDSLHYFAHWVTPSNWPKRWTTRFFLAQLPPGQEARPDGNETTESRWVAATDALEERRAGRLALPYPTRKTLEALTEIRSTGEIRGWAHARQKAGIHPARPLLDNDYW